MALPAWAATTDAERLCDDLERRLQSLKSLEILYEVSGGDATAESTAGRMVWLRPAGFYHDTPEWTLCQTDSQQWRFLKESKTLILERVVDESQWVLESLLFDLRDEFRPAALEEGQDGRRVLSLEARDSENGGSAQLMFEADATVPDAMEFHAADGGAILYRVTAWRENARVEASLFDAPDVPAENVLDFRVSGER